MPRKALHNSFYQERGINKNIYDLVNKKWMTKNPKLFIDINYVI